MRAEAWEDGWECGAVVLGTVDVAVAQPLAAAAIHRHFDSDLVPSRPLIGWYRLGMRRGERAWIDDPVRGPAGVWFTADYSAEGSEDR